MTSSESTPADTNVDEDEVVATPATPGAQALGDDAADGSDEG
jgi:hypothetical protein